MSRDGLLCYRLLLQSDYDSRADLSVRLFVEQRLLRLIAVAQGHKTQDEEEKSHESQRRKKVKQLGGDDGKGRYHGGEEEDKEAGAGVAYIGHDVAARHRLQQTAALDDLADDDDDAIDHIGGKEGQHSIEPGPDAHFAMLEEADEETGEDGQVDRRADRIDPPPADMGGLDMEDAHRDERETGSIDEGIDRGAHRVVNGPETIAHLHQIVRRQAHDADKDQPSCALIARIEPSRLETGDGEGERIEQHEQEAGELQQKQMIHRAKDLVRNRKNRFMDKAPARRLTPGRCLMIDTGCRGYSPLLLRHL